MEAKKTKRGKKGGKEDPPGLLSFLRRISIHVKEADLKNLS
jgi:hypothetical protein